jgi:hypothetical protein
MSGYAWCENGGWLYWGDGTPDTPPYYSNASATDYGVNFDASTGELQGAAWGENIGWVVFEPTRGGPALWPSGLFAGYAWGENIGWINLSTMRLKDTDSDGVADLFETATGVYISDYDTGTDPYEPDTDNDTLSDGIELTLGTDPNNPDTDFDGMPDAWENANGLDPTDDTGPHGADGDLDGDGFTNLEEYNANTNPNDYTSTPLIGDTSIDAAHGYAWGENIGWINFRANVADGVVVTSTVLAGYAWAENTGWVNFGDGRPTTPPYYSNLNMDHGVNLYTSTAGQLEGYAWSENNGWIVFEPVHGAPSILPSGAFTGYAWGENVGWIYLGELQLIDSDGDSLADLFETNTGIFVNDYDAGCDPGRWDTDGDGVSDGDEVALGTDPNTPDDWLSTGVHPSEWNIYR